jgi:hypothetical protein
MQGGKQSPRIVPKSNEDCFTQFLSPSVFDTEPLSSLQFRVLRSGLLQDGNVRIGVFPESEKIIVGEATLSSVAREGSGSGDSEMGKSAKRRVDDNARVVEDFSKLRYCGIGPMG